MSQVELSDFGLAKSDLLSIYADMSQHLQQIVEWLQQLTHLQQLPLQRMQQQLASCSNKLQAMGAKLQAKRMKAAFFGRTSNGKSAVINAMLHERVMPSAMGHTTSCFCEVAASEQQAAAHVMIEGGDGQELSIEKLKDLASAHSWQALSARSLLHVRWPSSRCGLLAQQLVLLDTPGMDVNAQLDACIDGRCLTADVFVLVLNAESTISRVERQFLALLAQQLDNPHIFILNNRWDAAAALEPQLAQLVREQHTQRCLHLLITELRIYQSAALAKRRIFHVSALETLRLREQPKQAAQLAASARQRYAEFESFEREFGACIARSALQSKLAQPCAAAAEMLLQIAALLQQVQLELAELAAQQLSIEVGSLGLQLAALPAWVQQFRCPFVPQALQRYKQQLNEHVQHLLLQQLQLQVCQPAQQQLPARLRLNLPAELLNVQAAMLDFQPALQCRFSWGMAAMLQRLQCKAKPQLAAWQFAHTDAHMGGCLLLAGLVARSLGWRCCLGLAAALAACYCYELSSWTPQAQQRSYKQQYARHLQRRLRSQVPQAANALRQQLQQQHLELQQAANLQQMQQHQLQQLQQANAALLSRSQQFQQRYLCI